MGHKKLLGLLVLLVFGFTLSGCLPKKMPPPDDPEITQTIQTQVSESQVASEPVASTEIAMDAALNRKVNIFLSNFAESFMGSFNRDTITNQELVDFAVRHNYLNNYDLWKPTSDQMSVSIKEKYIEQTVKKYFGSIAFTNYSEGSDVMYAEGYYVIPLADGEAIPFVQIDKLTKSADGVYTANGQVYGNANYLSVDDPYKPFVAWSGAERDEVERYGKVKATFTEITEDGKSRFIIQTYSRGQ